MGRVFSWEDLQEREGEFELRSDRRREAWTPWLLTVTAEEKDMVEERATVVVMMGCLVVVAVPN